MCGILAVTHRTDQAQFQKAISRLSHRGPDDEGILIADQYSFGHRRLSIIDISAAGHQPFCYRDFIIVYNGEIFNYLELRKELQAKGYSFATNTDTEVICAAYEHWGKDCLHKFNGMWAFVLYDQTKKEYFISRDRFGIKPLFYCVTPRGFAFASEMKALFPFINNPSVSNKFSWCLEKIFDYEATEICLVEEIKRFKPGHYSILAASAPNIDQVQYWNTMDHLEQAEENYSNQVEHFRELFLDACRIRMRSDVKIGTALSGGVDSTAVISAMSYISKNQKSNDYNKDWQHAFVACFPGSPFDERDLAKKVTDYLGIEASFKTIEPGSSLEEFKNHFYLFEEIYLTSPVPMIGIYRHMKASGISVSLDGHGADELLAGYGESILCALKDAGYNFGKIRTILNTYYGLRDLNTDQIKVRKDPVGKLRNIAMGFGGGRNTVKYYLSGWLKKKNNGLSNYDKHLYRMFHQTILPTLLRNYDRYSMASGVEVRMPFLDHRLVTYSFSLPWTSKLKNGYTKSILRDSVSDFSPKEIIWRKPKIGFNSPVAEWMRGPWKENILDICESNSFKTCPVIHSEKVRERVTAFFNRGASDYVEAELVWTELTPYFWYEYFYKQADA